MDALQTELARVYELHPWVQGALGLSALFLLVLVVRFAAGRVVRYLVMLVQRHVNDLRARMLVDAEFLARAAQILPPLVLQMGIHLVPGLNPLVATLIYNVAVALTIFRVARTLDALLSAYLMLRQKHGKPGRSVKSSIQLLKLLMYGLETNDIY